MRARHLGIHRHTDHDYEAEKHRHDEDGYHFPVFWQLGDYAYCEPGTSDQ